MADGEELTTAQLKQQMAKMKTMAQNKKMNLEDNLDLNVIRSEIAFGELVVLKMFQSSLLHGICLYVKKYTGANKEGQRVAILDDPMIFTADDVPFMIVGFEKC